MVGSQASPPWYPPPSRPRPVEGGLQARSRRGAIGATWWSERFITVLESIGLGNRLQRGRNYARRGQVISLEVDAATVTARVQGSRARPYRVRIGIAAYGKTQWAQLEQALAGDAWFTAQLLAGDMPGQIEELFGARELPLFPSTAGELSMDCTCPDWQVPCKHLAAVFYLLAEAFDDDPFTILAWRGRDRDTLLDNLAAARSGGPHPADRQRTGKPLTDCLEQYYDLTGPMPPTGLPATSTAELLAQLPAVAVIVRDRDLIELLRPAYAAFGTLDVTS
jgi:uncharacterized Zn finger protein